MKTQSAYRRCRQILIAVLIFFCIFSNIFPFINIDLHVIILTPMRLFLFLISGYCAAIWGIRIVRKTFLESFSGHKLWGTVLIFMAAWSLCGTLWLIFGVPNTLAQTEVIGIITLFLYAFCFFTLIKEKDDFSLCLRTLVWSGLILALMADVEIVIGSFLKSSAYYFTLEERIASGHTLFPPSTVFMNTNDLCAFLLMCLAILLYRFIQVKTVKEYLLCTITAIILLSPTPICNSTIFYIAFAFLILISIVLLLCFRNNKKGTGLAFFELIYQFPMCTLVKFVAGRMNTLYFSDKINKQLPGNEDSLLDANNKILEDSLLSQLAASQAGYGTIHIRYWLIRAGIDFFTQSPWIGCGPGGFRKLIKSNQSYLMQTRNIIDPHNFFIELLCQYGIFFFLAYISILVFMLVLIFKRLIREIRDHTPGRGVLALLLLVAFVFVSILPSGFIRLTPIWLFFFCLVSTLELKY